MVWAIRYVDILSLDNNKVFRFLKAKSLMLLFCLNRKMPIRAALSPFYHIKTTQTPIPPAETWKQHEIYARTRSVKRKLAR